ncbi:MAG: DUF2236 domain-containing protein [Nocardiaceae bacterium]|nr:DUF2236 domain-containing protein [Nocardiaceae bacterium]
MSKGSAETAMTSQVSPAAKPDRDRPLDNGTIAFRVVGDLRLALVLTLGLIMQTMHPVVNAGVDQHSVYAERPWNRLFDSLMPIIGVVYDGADAHDLGRRIRDAHKNIKGVDDRGRQYHALNPDAYVWVWATIFDSVVRAHDVFGTSLSDAERRDFYHEWRYVGIGLGLHPDRMPQDLDAFYVYFDHRVSDGLEAGVVPRTVLSLVDDAPPPPGWPLGRTAWRVTWLPLRRLALSATKATLPESVSRQLGLTSTGADAIELAIYVAAIRLAFAVLPERARYFPRAYRGIRESRRAA